MKKPWHNRNNTVRHGRHRKPRGLKPRHQKTSKKQIRDCADLTFQEPAVVAPRKSRFRPNGTPGTKPEAVIIDMDGTLENWDGHPNPPGLEYALRHHAEGRVLIILTARDHEWSYERTHKWLREHLHVPFVGPICRPADDERYACDFKKHVYENLSVVYDIVSAIDDDNYVLEMWRSIPGLDVVATNYDYNFSRGRQRWFDDGTRSNWGAEHWAAETAGALDTVDDPDDEWLRDYEAELEAIKYRSRDQIRRSRTPQWMQEWENVDGGMDLWCNHCDHLWLNHEINGCIEEEGCPCEG